MIKVKRVLICLLALCFILALAGCGGGKEATTAAGGDKTAAQSGSGEKELSAEEIVAKGKAIKGLSFEIEMKGPEGELIKIKTWMKGENLRTEMEDPSGQGKVVTILNTKKGEAYLYQPEQNMATKIDINQMKGDPKAPQDPMEDLDPVKMKSLGKETVDGKKCIMYEVAEADNATSKVWIWEEYGVPVKMEMVVDGQKTVMEYKNIEVGDIPDSTFELPAEVQIMSFNMDQFNKTN